MPAPKQTKAPLWTIVFDREIGVGMGSCWHIQVGHKQGPELSLRTIKLIAEDYFKKNEARRYLKGIKCVWPDAYWNGRYVKWLFWEEVTSLCSPSKSVSTAP